jgi:hypothetical protein
MGPISTKLGLPTRFDLTNAYTERALRSALQTLYVIYLGSYGSDLDETWFFDFRRPNERVYRARSIIALRRISPLLWVGSRRNLVYRLVLT